MNIGILTGGGDCPGLNAAIRGVTKRSINTYGSNIIGIKNGWEGLVKADAMPLTLYSVSGILPKGGTILGTSRTNPLNNKEEWMKVLDNIKKFDLNALVAIGGDDTLGVALKLQEEKINVVGIPKTIDNDLQGTDYTFGFDTAMNIATEAIDRIHTTAESHHRAMVVEVMGRHTGWIAVMAGIAGGADYIAIPEVEFSVDDICETILERKKRGKTFSIIVVAEGAKPKEIDKFVTRSDKVDAFGNIYLGGIGDVIGKEIEKRTDMETRVTILGHTQRGGTPTPFDRNLATRMGVKAADLVHEKQFGKMVALIRSAIKAVPLAEAVKAPKKVPLELYDIAKVFFK